MVWQTTKRVTTPTLRNYMTQADYAAHVDPRLQTILAGSRLPVQSTSDGLCEHRASSAATSVARELAAFNSGTHKMHTQTYDTVNSDELQSAVRAGKTAVIAAAHNATEESRFSKVDTFHATSIIGESRDKLSYVLFDPDTTHDRRTQAAHDAGTSEPRHDLRLMAKDEVHKLRPFVQHIENIDGDEDIVKPAMKIYSARNMSPLESVVQNLKSYFKS